MSDATAVLLTIAVLSLIVWAVARAFANTFGGRGRVAAGGAFVCSTCGTRGAPKRRTKGSTLLELFLWLCLIIPGLIYSIWRVTSREEVCPACGGKMIPIATPRGRALIDPDQTGTARR